MKGVIFAVLVLSCCLGLDEPKQEKWTSRRIKVKCTAYYPGPECCGAFSDGKTATGRSAYLSGVAVDKSVIPHGSRLDIPGYGNWVLADDVGGAIKGHHIDVRLQSYAEAKAWGVKTITIRVWEKVE